TRRHLLRASAAADRCKGGRPDCDSVASLCSPQLRFPGPEFIEKKIARSGSLAEFLLASPLRGANLDIERPRDETQELPHRTYDFSHSVTSSSVKPKSSAMS